VQLAPVTSSLWPPDVNEQHPMPTERLFATESDTRARNRADQRDDFVLVDEFARLLRADAGIALIVFFDQLDLAAQNAAALVPRVDAIWSRAFRSRRDTRTYRCTVRGRRS
jgi:hypothetical protein